MRRWRGPSASPARASLSYPRSFIIWWRYRPPSGGKVHLVVGAHPAVVSRTVTASTSGVQRDLIVAARYLAGELSPSYSLANNLRVGAYYLYSYCLEQDAVKNTHFSCTT
jgi:hypothetical protein